MYYNITEHSRAPLLFLASSNKWTDKRVGPVPVQSCRYAQETLPSWAIGRRLFGSNGDPLSQPDCCRQLRSAVLRNVLFVSVTFSGLAFENQYRVIVCLMRLNQDFVLLDISSTSSRPLLQLFCAVIRGLPFITSASALILAKT